MLCKHLLPQRARVLYREHDRIPIPKDVPELGIRREDEGVIRRLMYLRNTIFAFVIRDYEIYRMRSDGARVRPALLTLRVTI
jgi:hypothetical protein